MTANRPHASATTSRNKYLLYVVISLALTVGPLFLVQVGVLTWVTDNMAIGLVGIVGFLVLAYATVVRLAEMGLPRWLAAFVILPYGLNLVFVVYLLVSNRLARARQQPGPPSDTADLRSVSHETRDYSDSESED